MRVPRWSVLAAGFVLLAAGPAVAQASSGHPSSDNHPPFVVTGDVRQVTYPDAVNNKSLRWFSDAQTILRIPEPSYYVAKSSVVDGSPAFDFGLETTSDQVIAASQIAFNEETGEAILAVGVPTTSSLQKLADGGADVPAQLLQSDGTATMSATSLTAAATWQSGRGAFGTFWTDPVGITVSDVITEIRWEYNGTNVRAPVVDDVTYVFSLNGWTQVSHSRGAYLNSARTVATGYSQAHHKTSSWFPPTCGTTRVKYYSNSAYGGKTGNISGGVTTWTEGSCGGLLSVQAFVYRGQV